MGAQALEIVPIAFDIDDALEGIVRSDTSYLCTR
jgi:hypothetical protein